MYCSFLFLLVNYMLPCRTIRKAYSLWYFRLICQRESCNEALHLMIGWKGSNLQGLARDTAFVVHGLSVRQEFAGVGLPLEIRKELTFSLLSYEGQRRYVSIHYNDEKLLAFLKWPEAYVPGEIRLTFVHGELEKEIFKAEWTWDAQVFSLPPLRTLPHGESHLVLEYIQDGRLNTISKQEVIIIGNRAMARFELYGRNYRRSRDRSHLPIQQGSGIYGNVVISHERPLQGVLLDVRAVYNGQIVTGIVNSGSVKNFVLLANYPRFKGGN